MKFHKQVAYEFGKEGFQAGKHAAPALNEKFMNWMSTYFNSWEAVRKRVVLYKEYQRGWNEENLRDA